MDILEQNIYALNLRLILCTQHIDAQFAVNYILNPDYQFMKEEEIISIKEVLLLQPHISSNDIERLSKLPRTCLNHFEKSI